MEALLALGLLQPLDKVSNATPTVIELMEMAVESIFAHWKCQLLIKELNVDRDYLDVVKF